MATINDLSDANLCEIFSYIVLVERQRLEIVCKRWQKLIQILWKKITELSFNVIYDASISRFLVREIGSNGLEIEATRPSEIGAILKLCANNLEELIVISEGPNGDRTNEFAPLHNCRNLQRFRIYTYDNNLIRNFLKYIPTESLKKLEVFNIEYEFTKSIDKIITQTLQEAEQLTSLRLSGVSLEILEMIGKKSRLMRLEIGNHNGSIKTEDLSLDFTNLINLKELVIDEERMVDNQFVIQIVENCKKLRRLKLYTMDLIHTGFEALKTLKSLRILDLSVPKGMGVLKHFHPLEEFNLYHSC